MALEAMNSPAKLSLSRRFDEVEGSDSRRRSKRQRRDYSESEEEYLAVCLVMLARSGGGAYPSSSTAAVASPASAEDNKATTTTTTAVASPVSAEDNKPTTITTALACTASADVELDAKKIQESSPLTPPAPKNKPTTIATALACTATASTDVDAKIIKESIPLTPAPAPAPRHTSYNCSVCNKAFSTYQALGGHKASHRVKPPTAAVTAQENNTAVAPNQISALNPSGRVHECSICHKTFSTGQALGGHKRKHYEGVIGGGAAKSRTTSSGGDVASDVTTVAAVARDFDLNLPCQEQLYCDEEAESALPPLFE